MKCFYHKEREASATCIRCGKSLCKECNNFKQTICIDCFIEEHKKLRNSFITMLIIYIFGSIVGGFLGTYLFNNSEFWSIYCGIGIIPAIYTIFTIKTNLKTNSILLIFIMFILRLIIAFVLSFLIIPIMIYKIVYELIIYIKHCKDLKIAKEIMAYENNLDAINLENNVEIKKSVEIVSDENKNINKDKN